MIYAVDLRDKAIAVSSKNEPSLFTGELKKILNLTIED